MTTFYRYAEDPTGLNPDNLVSGELYSLSNRPIRAAVPKYGPFFTETLIVYDNLTQRPLIKGIDYRIPTIARDATLKFGKEVADAVLIENSAVSGQIAITYQAVGGLFQNNIDNLVTMYEAYINDDRKVDWLTGILGKPSEYPTGPHPHWLSDLFGFETLNFQLERIAQAILLGNSPAFDAILQAIESGKASLPEMETGQPLRKTVTLEGLLHVLDKYNFNSVLVKPQANYLINGGSLWIDVTSSNVPDAVTWYWTIQHIDTQPDDFVLNSGILNMVNGVGKLMLQAVRSLDKEEDEQFRVQIRRTGVNGQVIATTRLLTSKAHAAKHYDRILDALKVQTLHTPQLKLTAKTYSVARSYHHAAFN